MNNKTISGMKYILYLFGLLSLPVQAASFDCAKVGTKVEKLICGDAELSKLDEELNVAYKTALQDEKQANSIRQTQKQWMKVRNGCTDSACVKQAYETRLSTLSSSDDKGAKHDAEQGLGYADNYVLDPAPKEMIDWNWEKYKKPRDKKVCSLYLQNLQYFARRNELMSCEQPIAPMLKDKIKKVEWENLDPEKYSDLFKAIIKVVRAVNNDPSKEMEWQREAIKQLQRGVVFRLLKFGLKGSPGVEEVSQRPLPEEELSIVQFGNDVTRPDNPQTTWRCHPQKGRIMGDVLNTELNLFIVSKDLKHIYYRLWDWRGYTGQNLWLINERIYGEFYDELANVKLTELRATDFGNQLVLEPVCLYHFKKTSHD